MKKKESLGFVGAASSWIEEKIAPGVAKFTENKYVSAIRQALLDTIPLMLIGSVFLIIWLFPVQAWMDFVAPFTSQLLVMVSYTFGALGLVSSFTVANRLARNLDMDPIMPSIFSVLSFLILSPPVEGMIPMGFLGGTGLFGAIIVGILTVLILRFFYEHKIMIKMPKEVPEGISNVFASILPGIACLGLVWFVRVVINFDFNTFILGLLQPLVVAGDSLLALNIEALIGRIAWSVGIHGYTVVQSVAMPFWTIAVTENAEAVAAGLSIPHIGTSMFLDGLALWSGTTTWPVIGILLFSKLRSFRALGRVNAPVGFFCIWEPIMFGLPIILNPLLIIPFILSCLWGVTFAWIMVSIGWVTVPYVVIPMITPPIMSGFLATGGDWRSIPLSVIVLVGATVIWYPFIKAWERIRALEDPGDVIK
ncbi:MAG TPA: PTS sugar transporter subunit IIC [Anaerolineae bacterium]|nr:PTS sugar transporter subunit IIC [Anaerolineae bacterium]